MNTITHPTDSETEGPWLIDASNLKQLDLIFDSCLEKMHYAAENELGLQIEKALAERISEESISESGYEKFRADYRKQQLSWRRPDRRWITIFLGNGRSIEGTRFTELMTLASVQSELPRGFIAGARVGEYETRVSLNSGYSDGISITVSPKGSDLALEMFGYLQNRRSISAQNVGSRFGSNFMCS